MTLRLLARTTASQITLVAALALFPTVGTAAFAQEPAPAAQDPAPAEQEPAPAAEDPAPTDAPLEAAGDQAAAADVPLDYDQVQALQQALKDLGYFYGPADGRRGPRTDTAVRNFQRDQGLEATGNLDNATVTRIDEQIRMW